MSDEFSVQRRNLPMVEVDAAYVFDGPEGAVGLIDLFECRSDAPRSGSPDFSS